MELTEVLNQPKTDQIEKAALNFDCNAFFSQYFKFLSLLEFELNDSRIQSHMNLLTNDFILNSVDGIIKSKVDYLRRINILGSWKNALHILSVNFIEKENNRFFVETDILYLNILPNNETSKYTLQHLVEFVIPENGLPLIKYIATNNVNYCSGEKPVFIPSYHVNRSKSLAYYWFHCLNTFESNPENFKAIIPLKFCIEFDDSTKINNWIEFTKWLYKRKNQHYKITDIFVELVNTNVYKLKIQTEYQKPNDSTIYKTYEIWDVENNPDHQYPKIKHMSIAKLD